MIECTYSSIRLAGDLAEQHALRGFDAIHLASARELWTLTQYTPTFVCFDDQLRSAAEAIGMVSPQ